MAPGSTSTHPATSSFSVVLLVLLLSILFGLLSLSTMAQPEQVIITQEQVMITNGVLEEGQSLYDRERNYRLLMTDCNLVLYAGDIPIWGTDTHFNGTGCHAEFRLLGQVDRSLVIVDPSENRIIWTQPNMLPETDYILVLQPDRDVVIYQVAEWKTNTKVWPFVPHVAGDQVLISTGALEPGQYLIDARHNYKFIMQTDCNLVLYDGDEPIWASNTGGLATGCRAYINDAGNLVIRDDQGNQLWNSTNKPLIGNTERALILRPDRDLAVYGQPVWCTGTEAKPEGDQDGGLGAGRKAGIHMVTNKLVA